MSDPKGGQFYRCTACNYRKLIPEHSSQAPKTVRVGCPKCGYLQRFRRQGW